jgi:hypothetical protein
MEDIAQRRSIPDWIRQILSLTLTVAAAFLYAGILGSAVVRTFVESDPVFTEGTLRAARLLSGFVGAVVTAGFARGRRLGSTPVGVRHAMGGRTLSAWISLKPASRIKSKLVGLAVTLGLPIERALLRQLAAPDAEQPEVERALNSAVWVSLLYLVLYFVIGASAFALSIVRTEVPELIANAAWVWLGTLVSSGYAFFGVN